MDLVIGSPYVENQYDQREGRVYILYGPVAGTVDVSSGGATVLSGEGVEDGAFGSAVVLADVDANGTSDLFIGQTGWSNGAPPDQALGAVFLLLGQAAGF